MKKLFLLLIALLISGYDVFADVIPNRTNSIKQYGIGLVQIDKNLDVYSKPSETSKVLYQYEMPDTAQKTAIVRDTRKSIKPFVVEIPSKNLFYTTVYDYPETDSEWIQVYYNHPSNNTGFIKPENKNIITWKEFVFKYGKKNGLSIMRDVPVSEYKLYSQDSDTAKIVDEFSYPEYIALRMIRGNWMLVTVVDSGSVYKTGWFNWRTDDGKLKVFPNMK